MATAPIRLGIKGKGADEDAPSLRELEEDAPSLRPLDEEPIDPTRKIAGYEGGHTPVYAGEKPTKGPRDYADQVIEFLRPIAGAGAVAGGVRALAGAPNAIKALGGTLAAFGTDAALQGTLSKQQPTLASSAIPKEYGSNTPLTSTGEMLVGNELGGKITGSIFNFLKEYIKPGAVVAANDMLKLAPTYSQLKQRLYGKAPVSKWIEDVLASGAKARAIEESADLGMKEGTKTAAQIAGRTTAGVSNRHWMGMQTRITLDNQLDILYKHSDKQAELAKLVAKNNTVLNPQTGDVIEGPVLINNTLAAAKKYLDEKFKLFGNLTGGSDPEKQVIAAAQNILSKGNPQYDQTTGQIIRSTPISFEDAWNFKKASDKLGYGDPKEAITHTESLFKDISRTLNDDITNSLKKFTNDPNNVALKSWQNAKATVSLRHALYSEDGVRQLVNNNNDPIPFINDIIKDPIKLQRALSAGELKLPVVDPRTGAVNTVLKSTNLRRDLQGYQIERILKDGWTPDPVTGRGTYDTVKMTKMLTDWGMEESNKKLFSQQNRADILPMIKNLIRNIAITQQSQTDRGGHLTRLTLYHGGIAIPAALLSHSTNYGLMSVGASAVVLSGMGLARLLTNPKLARPLVALSAGQPVGVSDTYLSRALVGALQGAGSVLRLETPQGEQRAEIDSEGRLQVEP